MARKTTWVLKAEVDMLPEIEAQAIMDWLKYYCKDLKVISVEKKEKEE